MFDPEEFRAQSRETWEAHAPGWGDGAEIFYDATLPVSHWMVDHLEPQPGHTILEVGAGRGDTGLLAAELVQPGGRTIITDGAEAMVELARQHGKARGAKGVEFRPMELEWLDERTATVDGILGRFAYMLTVDPEAAFREARRVLKPGGRLVTAVWAAREANPWHTSARAPVELGLAPPPDPTIPGPFALSADGLLADLLEAAGFDVLVVEPIDIAFSAPSLDAVFDMQRQMSPSLQALTKSLSPADVYRLRDAIDASWAPYVGDDGAVAIPGRVIGAAAEA
ncbi:MAG TPA: methyltransferase domain-containing protein [Baekduia sp.]|nr:methyltransferase domain-containing protein [Baekduia sp.]